MTTVMEPYIMSTERIGLRRWIEADLQRFAQMNSDSEVMKYFPGTLTLQETNEMMKRINRHFDNHGFGLYALEKLSTNEFIGFTGFMIPSFESFFTPCIEIGWRIRTDEWNKGYATEAASACLQYGFSVLHFSEVYSFTSVRNVPSEKVMVKLGMKKVGEFVHPKISRDHWLCQHVLYKITKPGLNA